MPAAPMTNGVERVLPHARSIRHDLHRHPELLFKEERTAETVRRELHELGIEHVGGLARGTGVLAHLPATADPGSAPTIALRADMDALPIREETGREYASTNDGVMHACGHDGHTAILLATARILAHTTDRPNNVTLVFQPAEEGGAGGDLMCRDGALDGSRLGKPADTIFGLHGWPQLPVGTVATRPGPLLAATNDFRLTIRGTGGHAAYPHDVIDPIVVASQIISAGQTIVSRNTAPHDAAVVSYASISGGDAMNVIPEAVTIKGTIRTISEETRREAADAFVRMAEGIAASMRARAEIEWVNAYPVTYNDAAMVERFRAVARQHLGEDLVHRVEHPTMGGEDFSFYAQRVPSCFFFLGLRPAGADGYPGLHTPTFDFNDDALPTGIGMMCALATAPVE